MFSGNLWELSNDWLALPREKRNYKLKHDAEN